MENSAKTRREMLSASAKAGLAAAVGMGVVGSMAKNAHAHTPAEMQLAWNIDAEHGLPKGLTVQLLQQHNVLQAKIDEIATGLVPYTYTPSDPG